jgi:hypothetical protein
MPDNLSMTDLVIMPAGADTEPYVELGSRGATGTVFRKHILNLGPLHYQGKTYNLDDAWYQRLSKNFDDGVSMVQAPVADGNNRHSEDPLRNAGEVIGVEREGNKVYTVVDVRNPEVAKGLRAKTILGASAMLSMNYKDTRTDKHVGPALLHHCFTNRPHVLDLEPYQEIVAATSDSADMDFDSPIVLATEETVPELTRDELVAQLKDKHGIDVAALTQAAEAKVDLSAVVDALKETGVVSLSGESLTQSDVVGAIVELNAQNQRLSGDVAKLTKKDAVRTVEEYIEVGRLLPKAKNRAVEILLSAAPEDLDDFLAPEDAPYIKMSAQRGTQGDGDEGGKNDMDVAAETQRLADQAKELRDGKKKTAAAGAK